MQMQILLGTRDQEYKRNLLDSIGSLVSTLLVSGLVVGCHTVLKECKSVRV